MTDRLFANHLPDKLVNGKRVRKFILTKWSAKQLLYVPQNASNLAWCVHFLAKASSSYHDSLSSNYTFQTSFPVFM